jgi:hypothetical protein
VLGIAAALATAPAPATAASVALTSRTVYHAYQVRLADDRSVDAFRNLNRFYEWIDGRVYATGPDAKIDVVLSLRFDHDFGTGFRRDTPPGFGLPATDEHAELQVAYLYVDWRDLAGVVDLRLGRQLVVDDLDWYSLDGLKAAWRAHRSLTVEAYAGRAVPIDAFLSSEPFLNDGVELADGPILSFGGGARWRPIADLSVSAAFRQELMLRPDAIDAYGRPEGSADAALLRAASGGKIGTQERLLGASLGYTLRPARLSLYGHGVWNLLFGALDRARAGLAWDPSTELHVGAEYLRVRPRFAGDSIFNVFNIFPYDRGRLELTWSILPGLVVEGGYFLQSVNGGVVSADPATGDPGAVFTSSNRSHGPSAELRYGRDAWTVGALAEAATNFQGRIAYGGNYRRFELYGDAAFLEGRLAASLRGAYTGFQNDWYERADSGEVQPEVRSWSLDAGLRGEVVEGLVFARANFIKNFQSLLAGGYRVYTAVEVRY